MPVVKKKKINSIDIEFKMKRNYNKNAYNKILKNKIVSKFFDGTGRSTKKPYSYDVFFADIHKKKQANYILNEFFENKLAKKAIISERYTIH